MVKLLGTALIWLGIIKLSISNSLINIVNVELIPNVPGLWLFVNLLIYQFAISEALLQCSWFSTVVDRLQKIGEVANTVGASLSDEGLDVCLALGCG
jgi:hypothetical protein